MEYAQFVSGPYCGKLLAELGADVVKVEPPEGDVARRRGPFPDDLPHPEKSGLFLYLNTNKLGVTLNATVSAGKKLFLELLREADVLIEDGAPGYLDELGIGPELLKNQTPKLIVTSITPFGQSGPYRDYKADYLNTFHSGGEGYCMPGGKGWTQYPDREPLRAGAYYGEAFCGLMAAVATTFAVLKQLATGVGEHIDVSKQESLLALNRCDVVRFPNEGVVESRALREHPVGGSLECKDGFVQASPLLGDAPWSKLMDGLGRPEWAKDESLQDQPGREKHSAKITAHLEKWAAGMKKFEAYHLLQKWGVPAGVVESPEDILSSPQLGARNYFLSAEHQVAGSLRYAGLPLIYSGRPRRPPQTAPLLGQHNELVYCERLGHKPEELSRLRTLGVI